MFSSRKCLAPIDAKQIINYITKKRSKPPFINYSASRTRTYDIMINSHALLPTELWRKYNKAWQRPTLAGRNPQLLSALRSLTSVFEMGTGVSFLPSSPHFISEKTFVLSKLNLYPTPSIYQLYNSWLSPRPISTSPLHASRHFHF